tara:strand:+ start:5409 stop:6344 length:936 start_codon:yes stop_codon:yes gene_type:complete
MKVYRKFSEILLSNPSALTIGNFDGVHLGHQEILRNLSKKSNKLSLESLVVSFYPSPSCKLNPKKFNGHIDSDVEKIEKLKELKIDKFLIMKFDDKVRRMSADIFLSEIIIKKLNPTVIIVGYDHHFGYKREGDYNFLKKNKSKYGYELFKINEKFLNNKKISSSIIREMIADCDVNGAAAMLGRPYQLNGKVIAGDGIGKSLGFPTANIEIDNLKILPGRGVYFVRVINESAQQFYGMCNIGTKPTFKKNKKIYCEVNIFDFNDQIYNSNLKIEFINFIRLEKKFKSISFLKKQLISDKNKCLEYSYNNV